MIVLIAVGGVYVITMIGLLIYFLMALGVFEPSPIRYYPKGAKTFRIALTIGTLLFTGGLMYVERICCMTRHSTKFRTSKMGNII